MDATSHRPDALGTIWEYDAWIQGHSLDVVTRKSPAQSVAKASPAPFWSTRQRSGFGSLSAHTKRPDKNVRVFELAEIDASNWGQALAVEVRIACVRLQI